MPLRQSRVLWVRRRTREADRRSTLVSLGLDFRVPGRVENRHSSYFELEAA